MKKIHSLSAAPLDESPAEFGKVKFIESDWNGPIALKIHYEDGTEDSGFVSIDEYNAYIGLLKAQKKTDADE